MYAPPSLRVLVNETPYTKLQRALDELLAQFVKDYGETAIMRLIESNQRTEAETKQVPIPVTKEELPDVD